MPGVTWKTEGALTRLTLARPDKLNALGESEAREFAAAVSRVSKEKSRVVLLEGQGKAFCAGGDLAFIEGNGRRPKAALAPLMERYYRSFLSVRTLPQIVVAKVHGSAVGAGLCLALACDLRVTTPAARLGFNFVRLGLNPGMAAWPLARAIFGEARAKELLMLGRFFTGADLHRWGAACAVDADVDAAASALVAELLSLSPVALRLLKGETAMSDPLAPFLRFEARGQAKAFKAADIKEGLAAVREKRPPRF